MSEFSFDIEDEYRVEYINQELCKCSDEIVEISKAVQEETIELEIAKKMADMEAIEESEKIIAELKKNLEYLDLRYDALEDLWDDLLFRGIMFCCPVNKNCDVM